MLSPDLLREADRILTICNACRYCEGICPVFPALERRESFGEPEVLFLGNLCHDCRACYYVCPYADPHEFNVNLPVVLSQVRTETYAGYAWPSVLSRALSRSWRGYAAIVLVLFAAALVIAARGDAGRLFAARAGAGSFYDVIPFLAMVIPASVMSLYAIGVVVVAAVRFWRATRTPWRHLISGASALQAAGDALGLRHLGGGGPGCYTEERPSQRRRIAHSLVFYGFLGTFLSTVAAAIQQEILGWLPPYPILSVPVIAGSLGGLAMVVGALDLIRLKLRSDQSLATRRMRSLDFVFLVVLVAISASGLLLLALRESTLMPILLSSHLALIGAFFLSAPYGKFAHFVYRYGALVQDRMEAMSAELPIESTSTI